MRQLLGNESRVRCCPWCAEVARAWSICHAVARHARRLAVALVYGKVRAALGIRQAVVSGGGSLAPHLDDFYEAIGLPVINGWGLTVPTIKSMPPSVSAHKVWEKPAQSGHVE